MRRFWSWLVVALCALLFPIISMASTQVFLPIVLTDTVHTPTPTLAGPTPTVAGPTPIPGPTPTIDSSGSPSSLIIEDGPEISSLQSHAIMPQGGHAARLAARAR